MLVKVVNHEKFWEEDFNNESKKLRKILDDNMVNIFHIGSTSVKGLKAKPIIDILLVVKSLDKLDGYADQLEELGYEVMGEFGIPERRYYRKGRKFRTHHIHAFRYDNINEIERHLLFRDYLRENQDKCKEYEELKSYLANKYTNDIDGYCNGKNEFVKQLEKEAITWHWEKRQ